MKQNKTKTRFFSPLLSGCKFMQIFRQQLVPANWRLLNLNKLFPPSDYRQLNAYNKARLLSNWHFECKLNNTLTNERRLTARGILATSVMTLWGKRERPQNSSCTARSLVCAGVLPLALATTQSRNSSHVKEFDFAVDVSKALWQNQPAASENSS